jgi:hypothetical protein
MVELIPDLDFKSWLSRKTSAQPKYSEMDYSSWFSSKTAGKSLQSLARDFGKAQSEEEREKALIEAQAAMVLYSMLIYHLYPSTPSMKRVIDGNPELRQNFERLKGWFDTNGGKDIAEEFYRDLTLHISENNRS